MNARNETAAEMRPAAVSEAETRNESSTPHRPPWRPLSDLQRATAPQDGRSEPSEPVSIPPGEKLADQAAEARAWGDRERAS